jgi:hypothetical protein
MLALAATTRLAPGQAVWMENPSSDPSSHPFLSGEVVTVNGAKAEVLFSGADEPVTVPEAALHMANAISSKLAASAERAEPDNCDLLQLSEATLLHNTLLRYKDDKIYTFTCAPAARPARPDLAGRPPRTALSACSARSPRVHVPERRSLTSHPRCPVILSQRTHRHVSQPVQASSASVLGRVHEGEHLPPTRTPAGRQLAHLDPSHSLHPP